MRLTLNPSTVKLKPITHYVKHDDLEKSWDWNMGGKNNLEEYVKTRLNKPETNLYWITVTSQTAGMTGFLPHPDYNHPHTATFISKKYRGSNLNKILKHSFSEAFRKENKQLISSVDINNIASFKSLNKITSSLPEKVWEPKKQRTAYLYNITDINPTETSNQIVKIIQLTIQSTK